ncbi:MAG: polymer-forming cytoskeletal protein [Sphaerobacter sp.]|nr:polymer-forming cytoskeletal protein [Sphaerobacter sp.]
MSYRAGGTSGGYGEGVSPQVPESYSLIDRHSSVEGTFTSERDLRIEGQLRGTLRTQGLVYIAEGADVDATVEAAHITVAGNLQGQITCRGKLQIMPTGRVRATVRTETLVINEGAIYEGELHMDHGGTPALPTTGEPSAADALPQMLRRFAEESTEGTPTPPSSGGGQRAKPEE